MITRGLKNVIESFLRHTSESDGWQVQGFGMLRCYLPGENEPRLQIWDQRLIEWQYSPIHDHPWDFESTIVAGSLFNQRYVRMGGDTMFFHCPVENYNEAIIVPGPDNEGVESTGTVRLATLPLEMYSAGERYHMSWAELHQTRYLQGTVTYIERERTRPDGDLASSIWQGDGAWVSARPRPATASEARAAINLALDTWF